ncbi:hypothetical protein GWI33_011205, partial [Rhynchophorus ferrugineus]
APKDIFVSCINSSDSVTISGVTESVSKFVSVLKNQNVFVKSVNTGGYAFHSKLTGNAAPILYDFARKVITDPKPRSPKWISSCFQENEWDDPRCKMNSADYTRYNFENMVRFDQVLKYIPKDAIVIEIAPHGLLTPLIKRDLGSKVTCLTLGDRSTKNNLKHFLENIGKFYLNGGQPNLPKLYNKVSFPVGRGTANIGSLIKWDHSVKWQTPFFKHKSEYGKKITINISDNKFQYLMDYKLNGEKIMPLAGYLVMVWKVFADLKLQAINQVPVIFESVILHSNTILSLDQDIHFWINIMKHSGYFEIFNGKMICCQGKVKNLESIRIELSFQQPKNELLFTNEIYRILNLKGLHFVNQFRCFKSMSLDGHHGVIGWNGNYTVFLSSLLHVPAVISFNDALLMPSEIEKIVVDPTAFTNYENTDINFQHDTKENVIKCTGVEISNVKFSKVSKRPLIQDNLLLKEHIFVPYEYQSNDTATCISMAFQIIFENFGVSRNLRGRMEFKNTTEAEEIKNIVHDILETESYFSVEFIDDQITPVELIISDYRDISTKNLVADGFILFIGDKHSVMGGYQLVYSGAIEDAATGVYLLRHVTKVNSFDIVHVNNKTFEWIDKIKYAIDQCIEVLYLISSGDDFCGIMGLVRCLNFEPSEKTTFKCFVTDIKESTPFSLNSIFYRKQATKKLTLNVLKNGVWGSYRYLSLKKLKENDAHHAFNERENGDGIYRWYECPRDHICNGLKSDYVYVFYSGFGLNTVPIEKGILALNREESRRRCGYDYSGVTGTGVRVMGISFGNISLQTTTNHLLTWNIPDTWKLEEAATVPLSYYL